MIKSLHLQNFKLYKSPGPIGLSKINLLTGINGRGKSTLLQAFLLLNQSPLNNRTTNNIAFNGANVNLGSFEDVKNREVSTSEKIIIGFDYGSFKISYSLSQIDSDSTVAKIENILVEGNTAEGQAISISILKDNIRDLYTVLDNHTHEKYPFEIPLFDLFVNELSQVKLKDNFDFTVFRENLNLNKIHYVSADRIGPKNYYNNRSLNHFETVGSLGENTVNLLYHKQTETVNKTVLESYAKLFGEDIENLSTTIEDNTNYWLNKIFQGAKVSVSSIKGEDLLKLRISSENNAEYFKPTNVGYGFSYSLPIIVAGLVAKPGEILIVENPEAHLHPFAQSIIAKFLSIISLNDVQVFIESHSDHILNGLRVAIHDNLIASKDLKVLYFDKNNVSLFETIEVDSEGGIENWPTNFFDQATKDLNHLLGI